MHVIVNRFILFLAVSLSLTNISFFSIGLAEFTIYYALLVLLLGYHLIVEPKSKRITVPKSLLILFLYIFFVNLVIAEEYKLSSFVYSIFILCNIAIVYAISNRLELSQIVRIAKWVILLFAISISIGYLLIRFNLSPDGLGLFLFQSYNDGRQIRPMGLSSEPSYSAIILVFTLYLLFKASGFSFKQKDLIWYGASITSVFLTGSSYGYLLLAVLITFVAFKDRWIPKGITCSISNPAIGIALILVIILLLSFFITSWNERSLQRLVSIYVVLNEFGVNFWGAFLKIAYIDSSAGMRIVPSLQLIDYYIHASYIPILFGHGAGQATVFYSSLWGQLTLVGFIPSFLYNYGLLGALLAYFCLIPFFPRRRLLLGFMFTLFLFNADLNTQIFVYILFIAMLCKRIDNLNERIPEAQPIAT